MKSLSEHLNESFEHVNEGMSFNDLLDEIKIAKGKISTSGDKYEVECNGETVHFQKINSKTIGYNGENYSIEEFTDEMTGIIL